MNYFGNCTTRQEVKTAYYKYAMQHHPDRHPEDQREAQTEIMKEIINQYEKAIKLNYADSSKSEFYDHKNDLSFVDIIDKIFSIYRSAEIEITGLFLWIESTEETRQYKDQFKQFLKWSAKKKRWYFTPLPYKRVKKTVPMEDIRNHYGTQTVRNDQPEPEQLKAS